MGRPPSNGGPAFRFTQAEVTEMETILQEHYNTMPLREVLVALAEKFSNTPERQGKITVQMKQVWNWFQNKRYAIRAKTSKTPGKFNATPTAQEGLTPVRNVPPVVGTPVASTLTASTGKVASDVPLMEFEAKSSRDGAWYDVSNFISHRHLDTGEPEVLVRFAGFGADEDEWVNVCKHVRQRSLPCEASECVAVLPGDLILCFQEGKEQALYFDAHVLDAQRRRHDVRGCRCRFLVRYDHDESEEIVPLRKVCRRPETDYRLQQLHTATESAATDLQKNGDPSKAAAPPATSLPAEVVQKLQVSDGATAAAPVAPANLPATPGTTNLERKPAEVSVAVDVGISNVTAADAAPTISSATSTIAVPSSSSATTTSAAPSSSGPAPTTGAPSNSDEQVKEEK